MQRNIPGRFSQLPNAQRFPCAHSSTSAGTLGQPAPPRVCGRDPPTLSSALPGPASPWQARWSSVGSKPISHSQRYPPGALRHCPLSQRSTFSAHSSLSEGSQDSEDWRLVDPDPHRVGGRPQSLEHFAVSQSARQVALGTQSLTRGGRQVTKAGSGRGEVVWTLGPQRGHPVTPDPGRRAARKEVSHALRGSRELWAAVAAPGPRTQPLQHPWSDE